MGTRVLLGRLPSNSSPFSPVRPTSRLNLRSFTPLAHRLAAATGRFPSGDAFRPLSTRATTSSLSDPQPNWSNRPPKETILLDGCDFEHWLVVMEPPDPSLTRDEIIDSYIKTLAQVIGSEQEARMKIYSVSTKHYFAFGALVSEELSYKIKALPKVRWVLPDSYLDVKNKDYGGEPFISGEAVPYDPKYHEEWVRNNARANERSRRNDRPRNFDRSRNFERRRVNMQNFQNQGVPPVTTQGASRDASPPTPPRREPPNTPNIPDRDSGARQGQDYQNRVPGPQGNYVPNRDAGGYPAGPGSLGDDQGHHHGGSGYQGGRPAYQGSGPGPAYQGNSQGYQGQYWGGGSGNQRDGQGYQGNNSGNAGVGVGYHRGSQGYQGGGQGYQGGNRSYRGGGPGYQGSSQGSQGGSPGYEAGNSDYQQEKDVTGRDF